MNPRVGMVATVRNRRGIIASVEEYHSPAEGLLHSVRVEYSDYEGVPEDTVSWEREKKLFELRQAVLFEYKAREREEELSNLEEELKRIRSHYEDLLKYLEHERERVLNHLLPKRYTLREKVYLFPVAVEIRLSGEVK